MTKNRHGFGQVRRVHVHLPLHLPYALGTMEPAHLRARSCCAAVPPAVPIQPRIPGVPRMGTNGSTMLEPLRQGLPPIDPSGVSGSACCRLPARYEAVGGARRFTRTTLTSWDLGDHFDDVA